MTLSARVALADTPYLSVTVTVRSDAAATYMWDDVHEPGEAIVSTVFAEPSPQSIVHVYGPFAAPPASVKEETTVSVEPREPIHVAAGDEIVTTGGAAVIVTVIVAVGPVALPRVAVACSV